MLSGLVLGGCVGVGGSPMGQGVAIFGHAAPQAGRTHVGAEFYVVWDQVWVVRLVGWLGRSGSDGVCRAGNHFGANLESIYKLLQCSPIDAL